MGAERQRLRFELLMLRPHPEGPQRFMSEFKSLPGRWEGKRTGGLPQTAGYREQRAAGAAQLVMFDRSA